MKQSIRIVALLGALVGAFALGQARGQEQAGAEEQGGLGDMAAWTELGTPGPEHAELGKAVGTWTCEAKSWMAPGAEPFVDRGRATFSMVLGDRILKQEFEGAMAGTPYTGLGFTAFDKATRRYQSIWMDSTSTGIFMMSSTRKLGDEAWEYRGSFYGPGGVEVPTRAIMRKTGDDEQVMEMYHDMGRGETKSMELTYRRDK